VNATIETRSKEIEKLLEIRKWVKNIREYEETQLKEARKQAEDRV